MQLHVRCSKGATGTNAAATDRRSKVPQWAQLGAEQGLLLVRSQVADVREQVVIYQ